MIRMSGHRWNTQKVSGDKHYIFPAVQVTSFHSHLTKRRSYQLEYSWIKSLSFQRSLDSRNANIRYLYTLVDTDLPVCMFVHFVEAAGLKFDVEGFVSISPKEFSLT